VNQAKPEDLLLIYYSGHGKPNRAGILHLTTFDTVVNKLESRAIPINRVYDILGTGKAKKIVILLDCCYSGAAGQGFKGAVDDQLQQLNNARGTYLVTASTELQVAHESAAEGLSLFTKHLIAGLETGEADKDGDGWVSMNELYDYVQGKVVAENPAQHPTEHVKDRRGMNLLIAKSGKSRAKKNDITVANLHPLISPLIESALEELTIVCNKSALHVLDEDKIKSTLKALYEHGEILNSSAMYSWLLEHKWSQRPAKFVAKIATNISVGEQVRFKQKYYIEPKESIIQRLQQDVTNNSVISDTKTKTDNEDWQVIGKFKVKGGLAIDTETNLMWCRFAHGQTWENVPDIETNSFMRSEKSGAHLVEWRISFEVADDFNNQVGYGGYNDWRIPTIDELKTLIDKSKGKKSNYINAEVFPNNDDDFWSSTPDTRSGHLNLKWLVDFRNGIEKGSSFVSAIRFVRDFK
jgi:hypothetical protein